LPKDITDFETAKKVLMALAEEIGADARKHGKKGSTVTLTIKYGDFQSITRQKSVPTTYLTSEILKSSLALLQKIWNPLRPVRLLGISITGFEQQENGQLSLFDTSAGKQAEKEEKLEKTIDGIRGRFGKGTIKRAALLHDEGKKR
jgi:DNA polymerase-4